MEKKEETNKESNNQELVTKNSLEQVNAMTAIRQKNKKDVTAEEYTKHFQSLAFSQDTPLDTIHLNIEGNINYKAILYIPKSTNPFVDLNDPNKEYGPALYVQNVMIMDHCKDLLPAWMRHIVGIVETPDLPLNVSREILQQSSIMSKIQASLVKEVIKSLIYIKKQSEILPSEGSNSNEERGDAEGRGFLTYYANFGRLLKEWIYYDQERREEIASLLYFSHSSNNVPLDKGGFEGDLITLDEYIESNEKALKWLKHIYYLHTPSSQEGKSSPHIHKIIKRDLDVLFMTDPIDEYLLSMLHTYKEYTFSNIASSTVQLPELKWEKDSKKEIEKAEKEHKDFMSFVTSTIGEDKLEKVSFWQELGDSLAVLHTAEWQPTAQMVRMMKAMGQDVPSTKKTLIINPDNTLVKKYISLFETQPQSEKVSLFVSYLYEQALLLEGSEIESMNNFLKKANQLMNE